MIFGREEAEYIEPEGLEQGEAGEQAELAGWSADREGVGGTGLRAGRERAKPEERKADEEQQRRNVARGIQRGRDGGRERKVLWDVDHGKQPVEVR